ncbi:hypothetical protein AB0E67_35565 [Streptomyces sp. NPDC032161]|uniref:hypothetical protein n=1 Tax=unclassified Streptomyces TaxID=2593676 RepID=UPI003406149B
MVPGATYNHVYWDMPSEQSQYSYVDAATRAGFAAFNVDRIGTGNSAHPAGEGLTIASGAVALHDAITALRSGRVDGHRFQRVGPCPTSSLDHYHRLLTALLRRRRAVTSTLLAQLLNVGRTNLSNQFQDGHRLLDLHRVAVTPLAEPGPHSRPTTSPSTVPRRHLHRATLTVI